MLEGMPAMKSEIGPDQAVLPFVVEIKRDTQANFKASMDALRASCAQVNADIVFEYTSGSELFGLKVSTGAWARTSCKITTEEGKLAGKALLVFTAERVAPLNTGAGDVPGSLGPMDLEFGFDDNGCGSASLSALFKTLADAKTWVQTVRQGSGRPALLGSHWRFRAPKYDGKRLENQPTPLPDTAYSMFRATCLLSALPPDLASALPAEIIDCKYRGEFNPRQPQNVKIADHPGYNVIITGTLQVKGAHDNTFDAADTSSLAAGSWPATVRAALQAVTNHFAARIGAQIELPDEPAFAPSGSDGGITFAILGRAGVGNVLSLVENVTISRTTRNRRLGGSLATRVYKHRNGPMYKVNHDCTVTAKTLPAYPKLAFIEGSNWDEDEFKPSEPTVSIAANGTREYTASWSGAWTYVGPDPQADAETEFELIAGAL